MFENKIIFESEDDFYFENSLKPEPASQNIPDWWRNIPKYASETDINAVTVKACAPTLDTLTTGYLIKSWKDIYVKKNSDGTQEVTWDTNTTLEDEFHSKILVPWEEEQVSSFQIPNGFSSTVLKFRHGWIIKTPPGWSTLFVHPIGYQNLPLRSISGFVDTDILKTDINCPFVIKSDFEGIIPKGTPISQLIPIKRDDWKAVYKKGNTQDFIDEQNSILLLYHGYYASKRDKRRYR